MAIKDSDAGAGKSSGGDAAKPFKKNKPISSAAVAKAIAAGATLKPHEPAFLTDDSSLFPDKYSIRLETELLKPVFDSDDFDYRHPQFGRVVELERRVQLLQQEASGYRFRLGADKLLGGPVAHQVKKLSAFVAPEGETMTLHTTNAFRLFSGRARTGTEQGGHFIVGGARAGAAIKMIWYLSEKDNPYADFALISIENEIRAFSKLIHAASDEIEARFAVLAKRGLDYKVVQAPEPQTVELTFKSPYGFMIAEAIVSVDYFVRLVRTLVRHDVISKHEATKLIFDKTRALRGHFELAARYQRFLSQDNVMALSRADFSADADAAAKTRVAIVRAEFGVVPANVFSGAVTPRHSKRRVDLTAAELLALQQLAAAQASAGGLASVDMGDGVGEPGLKTGTASGGGDVAGGDPERGLI